jgi:PEGA domain
MRATFSTLVLTSLCGFAIGIASAHAETAVVVVTGKASAKERATVASAVRSAARSGAWQLAEAPLADPEIATVQGCLKAAHRWACVAPVLSKKGIERLILVGVDPEADGLTLTEHILLPGSDVATSDQRSCAKCIEERLTRVAFDLTKEMLQEAAAGTGRTKLRVVSTPPGAWVTVDTTNVGLTDQTYSTFPGQHVVTVRRDGFQSETRTVEVVENKETTAAFTLRPTDGPGPGPGPGPGAGAGETRSHTLEISFIAVGSSAIVGGVIAIALNQPDDAKPPTEQQPRYRYYTIPAGITAIVGGAVVGSIGGYLWWKHSRDNDGHAKSAPTVTPVAGGAVVGIQGVF